jgi:hypothetical protein
MTPILAANQNEDGGRPEDRDPAKAFVMAELGRLVEAGGASMVTLESGMRELRLATGEVFHLGHTAVTRVA